MNFNKDKSETNDSTFKPRKYIAWDSKFFYFSLINYLILSNIK